MEIGEDPERLSAQAWKCHCRKPERSKRVCFQEVCFQGDGLRIPEMFVGFESPELGGGEILIYFFIFDGLAVISRQKTDRLPIKEGR
jgi:hypothetical protein